MNQNNETLSHLIGKNTTNMKKIDERCFQHVFILTQHHKEIRNHPKWVSDV